MRVTTNMYRVLVSEPEGKKLFGKTYTQREG
jgi:hypothetical protein